MSHNTYLFTARQPSGDEVSDRVKAASAADAVELLTRRGFTEVRLHEDDSFPMETMKPGHRTHKQVPAAMAIKLRTADDRQAFLLNLFQAYRQFGLWLLVLIGLFAYRRIRGAPWALNDLVLAVLMLMPPILVLYFSQGGRVYRRVQELGFQGRWDEVSKMLPQLDRVLGKIGAKGLAESAYWKARVALEAGKRGEALATIENTRTRPGVSEVDVLLAFSRIYSAIPDMQSALNCYRRMAELEPKNPMGWMGIAEVHAVHTRQPAEAKAAIAQVRPLGLNEMNQKAIQLFEGAIALAEGRFAQAREEITKAIAFFERAAKATPTSQGFVRVWEALLAEACARSGDLAAARELLDRSRDYLVRVRIGHLVKRVEAALEQAAV